MARSSAARKRAADGSDDVADGAPAESGEAREKRERGEAIARAIFAKVDRARNDAAEFFQFVMRDELTRAKIVTALHQRLVFDFVGAHENCVVRLPPGFGKTMQATTLALMQMGEDPTSRCAAISCVAGQAEKPVALARDIIDNREGAFPEIRLVYPKLLPGDPQLDKWARSEIVIDRPPGIRDPSFKAYGEGSRSLLGSRLKWILVDDVLDAENTATKEACEKVSRWFFSTVLSREDVRGGNVRVIVVNTPWSKWDLTFELERMGWPVLEMNVDGAVIVRNTAFDSPLIRPALRNQDKDAHRLAGHDAEEYGAPLCVADAKTKKIRLAKDGEAGAFRFDLDESVALWPEVFSREALEKIQSKTSPISYARNYLMRLLVEGEEAVSATWVEQCKSLARALGHFDPQESYSGPGRVVHGVDIGVGRAAGNDSSAIFTYVELPAIPLERPISLADGRVLTKLPRGMKKILRARFGKWRGSELVDSIIAAVDAFGGVVAVENNAAQDFIIQWANERRADLPIVAHTTTAVNKRDANYGVESIFYMFRNGAWLIPNRGRFVDPSIAAWIAQCVGYQRGKHSGDLLMASWFAAELGRSLDLDEDGIFAPGAFGFQQASIAAMIGAR